MPTLHRSPAKKARSIRRLISYLKSPLVPKKHITFQTKALGLSKSTIVDIPSEPRKQKLALVKMKPISTDSVDSPKSEYSKPNPQPTPHKAFTIDDFKKCAK